MRFTASQRQDAIGFDRRELVMLTPHSYRTSFSIWNSNHYNLHRVRLVFLRVFLCCCCCFFPRHRRLLFWFFVWYSLRMCLYFPIVQSLGWLNECTQHHQSSMMNGWKVRLEQPKPNYFGHIIFDSIAAARYCQFFLFSPNPVKRVCACIALNARWQMCLSAA